MQFLSELTELQELLEMCLEENTDDEGNTQNPHISLRIDCYLSRSEYCLDELQAILERSSVAARSSG